MFAHRSFWILPILLTLILGALPPWWRARG